MVLSVLSILSYACLFDFTGGSFRHMMYLMYFRRPGCDKPDWSLIGLGLVPAQVNLPDKQTSAVLRTLIVSIAYVSLNFFLFIAVFRTLGKNYLKISNYEQV